MSSLINLSRLSVVFISFDEPNAEENYAHLREIVPAARHVHGVKGFDAAHRAAGRCSDTAHVITVDGDNLIAEPEFFFRRLSFSPEELTMVISFSAQVSHNGLTYGNGGIKIWPRKMLTALRTHEEARDGAVAVDFAWRVPYLQAQGTPSKTVVTASPLQAFRAGFREGVRLCMHKGAAVVPSHPDLPPSEALATCLPPANLERLAIWCSVGRDFKHGALAMLGARMGAVAASLEKEDIGIIADFDLLDRLWSERVFGRFEDEAALSRELERLGQRIMDELGLLVVDLPPGASRFFKESRRPQRRLGAIIPP